MSLTEPRHSSQYVNVYCLEFARFGRSDGLAGFLKQEKHRTENMLVVDTSCYSGAFG